jgi:hypothetical protein
MTESWRWASRTKEEPERAVIRSNERHRGDHSGQLYDRDDDHEE